MQGTNIQHLIGRLGKDAESKTVGEKTVTNFQVATEEVWKDKASGEKKKHTEWHNCELWGKSGVVKSLKKGTLIHVMGSTRHEVYEKKGSTEKGNKTKVVVDTITLLSTAAAKE